MYEPLTWVPISLILWLGFIVIACAVTTIEPDESFEEYKSKQW